MQQKEALRAVAMQTNAAVSIRSALTSDATDISRLTTQLGYEVPATELEPRLSRILARSDQRFFVAETDGHVVGWVHVTIADYVEADAFVVIGGLVVDRDYRRRGVGRLLMMQAEEWAGSQGCAIVRLWSTAARTGAHRFYASLGYTHIKTQYAFAKSLRPGGETVLSGLVPRVEP